MVGNGSRAEDVVHLVERYRPDVAVFAVGLTDGDGVEAARQVMASYPCALVLLTSRTEPEVAARAAEAGVLAFLAKPLRQEELGPALDLAVSRFRDLEAVRRENQELKRKLESRKLVDRAKALLIQRFGMTRSRGVPAPAEDGHGHAQDDGQRRASAVAEPGDQPAPRGEVTRAR